MGTMEMLSRVAGKYFFILHNLPKALEYLEKSLEIYVAIGNKSGEGTTLNNISQIYDARGDLIKALEYLERSLEIRVAIGDKSGMCATLFNIGHIHGAKEEKKEALSTWFEVYKIAKEIEYAQALEALDGLAEYFEFENFEALKQEHS